MRYHFGPCVLDTDGRELSRDGRVVPLEPKAYQVLVYLVEHRHRVVTRAELLEHVWPGTFVEDGAVTRCVRALRLAVGDSPVEQRAIQTRRGHGYRFLAQVAQQEDDDDANRAGVVAAPTLVSSILPHAEVEAPHPSGEYKPVTVLCGVFEPEAMAGLSLDDRHTTLEAVAALIERVVPAYGGAPRELASDRAVVVFGAPTAQEDHARRAVLAALALQDRWPECRPRAVAAATPGLPMRFGIDSGLAIVDAHSGMLVGEAPVRAAALAQSAETGAVSVSGATAQLLGDWIELAPARPMPGSNGGDPTPAHRVTGRRPHGVPRGRRGDHERSPFVGRSEEVELLHRRLARTIAGQGSIVEIVGQAGMGKSRLLAEFRGAVAAPVTYLGGRCQSHTSASPYAPLAELVGQLAGVAEREGLDQRIDKLRACLGSASMDPATWLWALLDVLGVEAPGVERPPLSPESLRARTFTALHQLFLQWSHVRPLVIEVDDLHWIDATSEAYLTELATRIAVAPVLLLTSYRSGYRPAWSALSAVTQIALSPLSADDCAHMLRARLGRSEIDPRLADRIVARAQGNPLFLEELAQAAQDGPADGPVSDTIQTVIAARLDRLSPGARHVIQAAAVIGTDASASMLRSLTTLDDRALAQHLDQLQAGEVLFESHRLPEPVYTFTHVLIRDVAYHAIVRRARQQLHARLVDLWTTGGPDGAAPHPALLAHHAAAAGLTVRAVAYCEEAARHAMQRSACTEASQHLTKALDLLAAEPTSAEGQQHQLALRLALGNALIPVKGYAAADVEQNYAAALALCREMPETPELCPALAGLETFYFARADLDTARKLAEQCLGLGPRHPDPVRAQQAHQSMGRTLLFLGEPSPARSHLERAIAMDDVGGARPAVAHYGTAPGVTSRAWASVAQWLLGDAEAARSTSDSALAQARALGHPHSLAYALAVAGLVHQLSGDVHAADKDADALVAVTTDQGFAFWGAVGTIWRGWVRACQGRTADGIADMRRGLADWRALGAVLVQPYFLSILASACGETGRIDEGLVLLDEAEALVERTKERWWAAELRRLRGELLLGSRRSRRRAEATACFREAMAIAGRQGARALEQRVVSSLERRGR